MRTRANRCTYQFKVIIGKYPPVKVLVSDGARESRTAVAGNFHVFT